MKLHEAFFLTLLSSIVCGALIFIGSAVALHVLLPTEGIETIQQSLIFTIGLILFAIYAVIQLLLSLIHLLQAMSYERSGKSPDEMPGIHPFYQSMIGLYCIIFIPLSCTGGMGIVAVILAFSLPYILCCGISVFIFRSLLRRVNTGKQGMHDSAPLPRE